MVNIKIAFRINHFSVRGSEVAIYDYAKYNKEILGNISVIVVPAGYEYCRHYTGMIIHSQKVESKFRQSFPILSFHSDEDLDTILRRERCDILYELKSGENTTRCKFSIPHIVHCIFTCSEENKHGDVYAAISSDVAKMSAPIVPHICSPLPHVGDDLRQSLGICRGDIVFGRHGGLETFDIAFVQETVKKVAHDREDIHFVFMNTEQFFEHPRVHYLEICVDDTEKSRFVNTCDAMLYARKQGESFGLAIAEFTTLNKPIIVYKYPEQNFNHLTVLGDSCIQYTDETNLYEILTTFDYEHAIKPVNYAEKFTPKSVMRLFQTHFIDPFLSSNYRIMLLCNWTSTEKLHRQWQKLIGDYPIEFVESDPDYWVILNKPPENIPYLPSRTIVMGMEPDTFSGPRWQWYADKSEFLYFLDENYMNNWEWWLDCSQKNLLTSSPDKKYNSSVSAIVSSQYSYLGHRLRVDFLRQAEKELDMHIYGWDNTHGFKSYKGKMENGKDDGLMPYKYTFAAENSSRENYCTEKLIDGILSECLVFYWGCPNTADFLDPNCYIALDLYNIPDSIQTIRRTILDNEWEKRIDAIRAMKKRILTRHSFAPRILGLLDFLKLDKRTINLDSRPEKWLNHMRRCREAQVPNVQRFSAITGSSHDLSSPYIQNLFLFTQNFIGPNKNTDAIVGCALSHYALWREVALNDCPMLIMEDDVIFQSQFVDRMGYILNDLKDTTWDIVFIGFHNHEHNCDAHNLPRTFLEDNFHLCDRINYKYMIKYGTREDASGLHGGGTFGYLLSPLGAQKLVQMVKKCRFYFPVDYQILECGLHYGLDIQVCPHQLVKSPKFGFDTSESDIQML